MTHRLFIIAVIVASFIFAFPNNLLAADYAYELETAANRHQSNAPDADLELGIVNELAALDFEGAYRSFTLPARFIESYIAVDEKQKALDHLNTARDGLTGTLRSREASRPESDYSYPLPSPDHLWYFFTGMNERFGWQQQNDNLRQLISELETSIRRIDAM